MKAVTVNDTAYDAETVRAHRDLIIQLRDEALRQNDFEWSIILSCTVGLLFEMAKLLEE